MPAKKKAKRKFTAGVLCRDKDWGCYIGFFPKLPRSDVWLGVPSGLWWGPGFSHRPERYWTLAEWRAAYEITDENGKPCAPPRKGQAFECEVQL